MNTRYRKICHAIFAMPTTASLPFADIEALVLHLGGQVLERQGSRVKLVLGATVGGAIGPIQAKRPGGIRLKRPANFSGGQG